MLSNEVKQSILELQKLYPTTRSALIPALYLAQAEIGYLPVEVQDEIAALFDIPTSEVNGVVTFYDLFYEKPQGKHHIHICKNISCMLRGCDPLIKKLCEKLQIQPGETSADGEFTVIPSECLGACDRAPMMLVDEEVVGPVEECDLDAILDGARRKRGPHG